MGNGVSLVALQTTVGFDETGALRLTTTRAEAPLGMGRGLMGLIGMSNDIVVHSHAIQLLPPGSGTPSRAGSTLPASAPVLLLGGTSTAAGGAGELFFELPGGGSSSSSPFMRLHSTVVSSPEDGEDVARRHRSSSLPSATSALVPYRGEGPSQRLLQLAQQFIQVLDEIEGQLSASESSRGGGAARMNEAAVDAIPTRVWKQGADTIAPIMPKDLEVSPAVTTVATTLNSASASVAPPSPTVDKKRYSTADCYICLDVYLDGDRVRELSCGHEFHQACLDNWLTKFHASCPICRANATMPPTAPAPEPTVLPASPGS